MEDSNISRTPNASRLLEFLKEAYTKDDEVERIPLDKCGWRTLGQIADGTGLPTRPLYGKKPGESGAELKQLVKDRLIEVRYFKGERGRGGEVIRYRILPSANQRQKELTDVIVATKERLEQERPKIVGLDKKRIAVLPFGNISPDPRDEYFADGITEELISMLSRIRGLKVVSRTSVLGYKQTNKRLTEIAKELNVGTVLEGSVRKMGDDLRINAQLIDVENDEHLWSQYYDRKFENVFSLQAEIAQKVADSLQITILANESRELGKRPTQNMEAYTLYLKGRSLRHRVTLDSFRKTIEYCEQAIQEDPNYAQAYAEIARSYAYLGFFGLLPSSEVFPQAERFAGMAIQLDLSVPDSHLALGLVLFFDKWDFRSAEIEMERALELNPNMVDGHIDLACLHLAIGRSDKATLDVKRALELDPLSANTCAWAGSLLGGDEAVELLRSAIELNSNSALAHDNLGIAYVKKGMIAEGISELKMAVDISGGKMATSKSDLAYAYAKAGNITEVRNILADLLRMREEGQAVETEIGGVYVSLGEKDKAIEWLEKAYERRAGYILWINPDTTFDDLRPDPRFQALLKKIGFPHSS